MSIGVIYLIQFSIMSGLRDFLYLCVLFFSNIEAARILAVFPTPSISHQVVFRPLTHELARRGHEVVVITTDPVYPKGEAPENLTEIDVHNVSYKAWREQMAVLQKMDPNDISAQTQSFFGALNDIFEQQFAVAEVRKIIKNKNDTFDLLLVEAWTRYALGFSHVVKAPVIAISSFGAIYDNYDVMGAPTHPILYPQPLSTRIYDLTLWEKVNQYYMVFLMLNEYEKLKPVEDVAVRRIFGEDTPSLSELQNNIDMLFLNIHPIWEGNRPVPPGVVHIGGMHQIPERELPQDLKEYLNSSIHGVIYVSFGTNVDTSVIPVDKIQAMVNVLSELPYNVLWKWNQDELPGRTQNIKISKWFPQSDLLKHPKIKLFITQGGLQSTDETITAGVPVIGIPMIGDQFLNVENYEHHKIGKKLHLADLNEETFKSAVKIVIENKSYRDNIVRLRTLMNDQPMTSLERAVWWTEHVLRHGGARHLRAPAANMPWAEYYEFKLVLIILTVALTVISLCTLVLYKIVKLVLRYFSSSAKMKSS